MRLNKGKKELQALLGGDLKEVKEEFKKRGFENFKETVKVYGFQGEGLPIIYLKKKKDGGPLSNSLMISPNLDLSNFKYPLEINSKKKNDEDPYLFKNSNVSFEEGKGGFYRVFFYSEEELGRILDNLIKIKSGHIDVKREEDERKSTLSSNSSVDLKGLSNVPNAGDNFNSDLETVVTEGGKKHIFTITYERSELLRRVALKKFGYSCQACGINFEETYGDLGKNFIEVHHKVPVSDCKNENDYTNLVPLCPNCHRMIHRLYKQLKPEEFGEAVTILSKLIKKSR